MYRHSRTSPASSILNLCKQTEESLNDEDMDALRKLIYEYPGISEQNKDVISNLVTIVVFQHDKYRKALSELESFLKSLE